MHVYVLPPINSDVCVFFHRKSKEQKIFLGYFTLTVRMITR